MRASISWAFAGNAAYAACQWIVFVLLVRSLTLAEAGQFAYWTAVTGPVFVLAGVRLRNLVATDVESPTPFADYLRARLLTTGAALCVALGLGWWLSGPPGTLAVVALLAAGRTCEAISDICHGLFQREHDMRSAAIGLLTNGIASVTLVGLSLVLWPSLAAATAAYAAASLLAMVAWDLPRTRSCTQAHDSRRTGSSRAAWRLIRRALPLGLSAAVGSLQMNLPRYVVAAVLGHAALAVFTALSYITTLGNLIANAVAQAALPALARDLRTSPAAYRKRLYSLVTAGVMLGALGLLATIVSGHAVLSAVYGPDVAARLDVLLWLMVAAAVTYAFVFLGTAATARRRYGAQLLISSAGLLTVAASIVPLVHHYGLVGAAGALCAGAVLEGCAYVVLTRHDVRSGVRLYPTEDDSSGRLKAAPTTATGPALAVPTHG
jgi:O-antigen/teichoic acid export membrane protein